MAVRILFALVVAAAAAVLQSSAATTYRVGDSSGWSTPFGGGLTFSNWAAQYTFVLGDFLIFDFTTGQHTAARVNQDDFNNCNIGNPISIQTKGPANFTLDQLGPWYFICTESNHCSSGQKLLVNVTTSAARSPNGSPGPRSSAMPPPPPPPSNSANMPTTAAASLIFLFIAMAFLF